MSKFIYLWQGSFPPQNDESEEKVKVRLKMLPKVYS